MVGEYRAPVTVITYRCSDKSCQKDIDKKTTDRKTFQKQQDESKLNRIKNINTARKAKEKLKQAAN